MTLSLKLIWEYARKRERQRKKGKERERERDQPTKSDICDIYGEQTFEDLNTPHDFQTIPVLPVKL